MASNLNIDSTLPIPIPTPISIPRLGFGVYRSPTDVCIKSCLTALKAGYRHIDTAQFYANEAEVGQAVQQSGLKRSDVFLTTKILSAGGSVDASYKKCLESVRKLNPGAEDGKGYVDLFLIHSPNAGSKARKEMWLALERLYEEGLAKSIGVSNWGIGHINEAKDYAKVWPPQVDQIEVSLFRKVLAILDADMSPSFTPGASSVRLLSSSTPTISSWKRTLPW
jgi:diketogulonate reductase-like aldo/keto reductase